MKHSQHPGSVGRKISAAESGQAAMEFALIAALMLVLFCMLDRFQSRDPRRAGHGGPIQARFQPGIARDQFVGLRRCSDCGGLPVGFEQQRGSDHHLGHQHQPRLYNHRPGVEGGCFAKQQGGDGSGKHGERAAVGSRHAAARSDDLHNRDILLIPADNSDSEFAEAGHAVDFVRSGVFLRPGGGLLSCS